MRYLALDLGSSWTKTALLEDGNVLQERSVPTPMPKDTTGLRFEIDAETYFRQVQTELEYYLPQKPGALLLSTQMHGCVLTDAAFQPLTPYISCGMEWGKIAWKTYAPLWGRTLLLLPVYH